VYKLWIEERYCKGCLICIEVCPTKAITSAQEINVKGLMCPDFAIAIEEVHEQS
jgi:ferredoxin